MSDALRLRLEEERRAINSRLGIAVAAREHGGDSADQAVTSEARERDADARANPSHLEPKENQRRGKGSYPTCKRGHPFDERNTAIRVNKRLGKTQRACRRCDVLREQAARAARARRRGIAS